ncbi:hypothetical protein [Cumulibacter manganitolerans]|uniref:hypothetical protein n=1 Tax=Cumulibacter manganitolerans TaxID=1884992 RepID=UPI001295E1CF|nr:hypothetical protein [Cumulibacter manganitolerans]
MESWLTGTLVGLGVGSLVIFAIALGRSSRDRVVFMSTGDVFQVIRRWAEQRGHHDISESLDTLTVHLSRPLFSAPVVISVTRRDDTEYLLEAWAIFGGILLKRDLALTTPGPLARLPREVGAKKVDDLLRTLGQPRLAESGRSRVRR